MFNFIKNAFLTLTSVIKTPEKVIEKPVEAKPEFVPTKAILNEVLKTRTPKAPKNEIDATFLELSKEMNIPFVKGPFANKEKKTTSRTPKTSIGMNNATMIAALKENCNNSEALATLFIENEELFIKNVSGIKDDLKTLVLPTIQTKYPNASIQKLNAKVKHVVLA